MYKFNDRNIFVGFVKQLLHTFNLPTIPVIREGMYIVPDNYYIYGTQIIQVGKNKDEQKPMAPFKVDESFSKQKYIVKNEYLYNSKVLWNKHVSGKGRSTTLNNLTLNMTETMPIKNLFYDETTHKFLGNYLRFIRDFKGINLMSLYNCFSNETVLEILPETKDENFIIYKVPVMLGQKYTIALDCSFPVEVSCGFYSNKLLEINTNNLYKTTAKKYNSMSFGSPIVFDSLAEYIPSKEEIEKEKILHMFIKVPVSNKSSVVVLEGVYKTHNNKSICSTSHKEDKANKKLNNFNHLTINFENKATLKSEELNLISPLQLLQINSGIHYPFADRLVEYLTENVITGQDSLTDNFYKVEFALKKQLENSSFIPQGYWDNSYKYYVYDKLILENTLINNFTDVLGYVDKNVEQTIRKEISEYEESSFGLLKKGGK